MIPQFDHDGVGLVEQRNGWTTAVKPEPAINAQVVERSEIARGLVVTKIRPDAPLGRFEPGQFVRLGVKEVSADPAANGKLVRRAYSIASAPKSTEYVEFL